MITATSQKHGLIPAQEPDTDIPTPRAGKSSSRTEKIEDGGRKPVIIRVPGHLLKRIDQAANKKLVSRSSFIVSCMADLLNEVR